MPSPSPRISTAQLLRFPAQDALPLSLLYLISPRRHLTSGLRLHLSRSAAGAQRGMRNFEHRCSPRLIGHHTSARYNPMISPPAIAGSEALRKSHRFGHVGIVPDKITNAFQTCIYHTARECHHTMAKSRAIKLTQ